MDAGEGGVMATRISVAQARKLGWLETATPTPQRQFYAVPAWQFTGAGCGLHVTVAGQISRDIPRQCMRCREVQRCLLR